MSLHAVEFATKLSVIYRKVVKIFAKLYVLVELNFLSLPFFANLFSSPKAEDKIITIIKSKIVYDDALKQNSK